MIDWMKILNSVLHIGMIVGQAYAASHPTNWGWLAPALQAAGAYLPPPDFKMLNGAAQK